MTYNRKRSSVLLSIFLSLCLIAAGFSVPAWVQAAESGTTDAAEGSVLTLDSDSEEEIENEYIVLYDDFFGDSSGEQPQQAVRAAAFSVLEDEDLVEEVDKNSSQGIELIRLDSDISEEEEDAFIEELKEQEGVAAVEKNRKVHALDTVALNDRRSEAQKEEQRKPLQEPGSGAAAEAGAINDTYGSYQYALESVRAPEAWEMIDRETAAVTTVAVVDTGIDNTHPDLANKVLSGYNCVDYNSGGQKYSSSNTMDDNGHGTHVAGIIGAICGNAMGITGVTGNLDIQLLPVKVLDDTGEGDTYSVVNGIKYAVDNGADIINMSLGAMYSSALEEAAVEYAESNGVLCIAAAGNEATDVKYCYPANYDTVLSVGAIDQNDERAYFSNYGQTLDVSAPGYAILSTIPEAQAGNFRAKGYTVYGDAQEGYYCVMSGTSMASPYAAGVAAIYKAVNPRADCSDIRNHLKETARDVAEIGFDIDTGYGCVDAAAALGQPIHQIAVRIKAPSSGSEIYETVNTKVQVNTNMGISRVRLYLNEVIKGSEIDSFETKEDISLYDRIWDTKAQADGEYTLIAQAYDKDDNPVGDPASSRELTIANAITGGYVVEVKDPDFGVANQALVRLAGQCADGSWDLLYHGYTTDLGYGRIKNFDTTDDSGKAYIHYNLGISGTYKNGDGVACYYYYSLDDPQTGTKLQINRDTAAARDTSFHMTGADGKEIDTPFVMVTPCKEDEKDRTQMVELDVWSMARNTEIWLSDGLYELEGLWSPTMLKEPDYSIPGYYLRGESEISADAAALRLSCENAGILRGKFDDGFTGLLQIESQYAYDPIPFLSGKLTGKVLYLSEGKYVVKASVSKEVDGEVWSVVLKKDDLASVTAGSDQTIDFSALLKLTKFEPAENSLMTDEDGTLFLYRGGLLRTINGMSISGDSVVSGFSGEYPTFTIYKKNDDGTETKIYSVTDTWQAKSSSWNSKTNTPDGQPAQAGEYRAELVFDAGPLGGRSQMEIDFRIKNKSDSSETDSKLYLGESSILPNAEMNLYAWNDEKQQWTAACSRAVRFDSNSVATIIDDDVTLNSQGINVAVIRYSFRKDPGAYTAADYNGFQLYYYEDLEDLKEIHLSTTLSPVILEVKDNVGTTLSKNQGAEVTLSLRSAGNGSLAQAEPLPDVKLPVGTVYIPDGQYDYIYSDFTAYGEEYFLSLSDAAKGSGDQRITLDGRKTKKVSFRLEDGLTGSMVSPMAPGMRTDSDASLAFTGSSVFYWSQGSYAPVITVRTASGESELQLSVPEFELTDDMEIALGAEFEGSASLNRTSVSRSQNTAGTLHIRDQYGNTLISSARKNGTVYRAVWPTLYTGWKSGEGSVKNKPLDSYEKLTVESELYQGIGEHSLYIVWNVDGKEYRTPAVDYTVTDGGENIGVTVKKEEYFTVGSDEAGRTIVTIGSGIRGYRTVTADIASAAGTQSVTFTLMRGGQEIASSGIEDVFNESENLYTAGFLVQPGDVIVIESALLTDKKEAR